MKIRLSLACFVIALLPSLGFAQDATVLSDSLSYAQGMAPISNGQIVNPSAVNNTAWAANGASTSVLTSTPTGLGAFSSPTTSSSNFATNNFSGSLSALGDQAMVNCANYVPTGNAMADQQCAAVNFMATNCITTSDSQNAILGAAGSSQGTSANCQGTYGAGASQFNYGNTVTPSDPVFSTFATASTNAASTVGGACTEQTVVTKPAQYSVNTCVKSSSTANPACSQTLNMTATIKQTTTAASVSSNCPAGSSYVGYVYPAGCWGIENYDLGSDDPCPGAAWTIYASYLDQSGWYECVYDPVTTYTCPTGSTQSGTSCISVTKSVATNWVDSCTQLENSAGVMLGTPS